MIWPAELVIDLLTEFGGLQEAGDHAALMHT